MSTGTEHPIEVERGRSMTAYACLPQGATRGVVVIHELFGRMPEIDRVVERFAEAGYAAVGPDLFGDTPKVVCIRRALATIAKGEGVMADRIAAARRWLCQQADLEDEHVGVIGFCIGGGLALAVGRHFAGVSTNYGDVPPVEVLEGTGPVIACYGGRDRIFRGNGDKLRARMTKLGRGEDVEVHMFPTVGHSFLTDGHHPVASLVTRPLMQIRWDPAVAEQGWSKIMAFFDRTL